MPKVRAIGTAVAVMEKEGITTAFGMLGAAINPLYSALHKARNTDHVLVRHIKGASHMTEGYTHAKPGNIGVCIGTSGPIDTDMITGLYSAWIDSIPILCITGQAPRARLCKEDFQAVDTESVAKPVTKWAVTVREPALMPYVFQQAFHLMHSGRSDPVLIDLPFNVQVTKIEFNPDTYSPLPIYKPTATHAQAERAIEVSCQAKHPLLVCGDGVINADAAKLMVEFAELVNVPVVPTLMGWGVLADNHPLNADMVDLQASHRYDNATLLASDFVFGIDSRWTNRHAGNVDVYTKGRRFIHVGIEPTQIGHVLGPDLGIISDAKAALEKFIEVARELKAADKLPCRRNWNVDMQKRKRMMLHRSDFDNVPIKSQRVHREMNQYFPQKGENSVRHVSTIDLSQIATAQFLSVNQPRHWINCGQADPLGWTIPATIGAKVASPSSNMVAISGNYDFRFMIEEVAVATQSKVPYIHMVANSSCLDLIRQAQRNSDVDYCVQLAFGNVNTPELNGYGADHVKVVEGLGCKAIRVFKPEDVEPALAQTRLLIAEFSVPVMMEMVLERVTDIAMGTEIDSVVEFEDVLDLGNALAEAEGVTA